MSVQSLPYYTIEQYAEMEETATYKSEFIAGRIYAMSGGTPKHSAIGNNIGGELRNLFRGQPCQVYNSDLRVGIMPLDVERCQRLDSLEEYLLVSQDKPEVEQYVRQESGQWNYRAVEGTDSASVITVLGVTLSLAEIYDRIKFAEIVSVRDAADAENA